MEDSSTLAKYLKRSELVSYQLEGIMDFHFATSVFSGAKGNVRDSAQFG